MRVALVFSGFLRCQHETINYFFDNIIRPYDCDVFMCTWNVKDVLRPELNQIPSEKNELITEFISLYKERLKDYLVRDFELCNQSFLKVRKNTDRLYDSFDINPRAKYHGLEWANRIMSMWYMIGESIKLVNNYESRRGISYDVVIRARTDVAPTSKIVLSDMKNNCVYTDGSFYNHDGNPSSQICSDFFWCDSQTALKLSDLNTSINSIYNKFNFDVTNAEALFYIYSVINDIQPIKQPLNLKRFKTPEAIAAMKAKLDS